MDETEITQYITDTFDGLDVVVAAGDTYFFNDPRRELPPDRRLPFATIVTSDAHDQVSNLNRPGVYRLNVGVSRETFRSLFAAPAAPPGEGDAEAGGHDFFTLDRIMPHPVYGNMFWLCVLNPSLATFQSIQPLLTEAYDLAGKRADRRRGKARPAATP